MGNCIIILFRLSFYDEICGFRTNYILIKSSADKVCKGIVTKYLTQSSKYYVKIHEEAKIKEKIKNNKINETLFVDCEKEISNHIITYHANLFLKSQQWEKAVAVLEWYNKLEILPPDIKDAIKEEMEYEKIKIFNKRYERVTAIPLKNDSWVNLVKRSSKSSVYPVPYDITASYSSNNNISTKSESPSRKYKIIEKGKASSQKIE